MVSIHSIPIRTSFWYDQQQKNCPPAKSSLKVDVAVVGGGFAGLSAARALKKMEKSLDIAILESRHLGFGASGRCAGFVSPLPPLTWLLNTFPSNRPQCDSYWAIRFLHENTRKLKQYLEEGTDICDLIDSPTLLTASNKIQYGFLIWLAERCANLGIPFKMISKSQIMDSMGVQSLGAVELGGFAVNPYKLLLKLSEEIRGMGVRIYEGTHASKVSAAGNKVEVLTVEGMRVICDKLVVATNAYTHELGLSKIGKSYAPVHSYLLATQALDPAALKRVRLDGRFWGEGLADFFYALIYRKHLLFGGCDKFFSKANEAEDLDPKPYIRLHKEMLSRFPYLSNVPIEACWAGSYIESATMTPTVRPLEGNSNIILNIGYGEVGMSLTHLSGRLVSDLILRNGDPDAKRMIRFYDGIYVNVRNVMGIPFDIVRHLSSAVCCT